MEFIYHTRNHPSTMKMEPDLEEVRGRSERNIVVNIADKYMNDTFYI
jgi:hypothetical protein